MFSQNIKEIVISVLLMFAVVLSAISVIYSSHLSRHRFYSVQTLQAEKDALQVTWNQLLLEQSAVAGHGQVERAAIEQLKMYVPDPKTIVMVYQ